MCRLFGFKASEKVNTSLYLERAKDALEKQSKKDSLGHKNKDGWGFGYYDEEGTPVIKKEAVSAYHNQDFENSAKNINSHIFISHIRAASFGNQKVENCHPFTFDRFIFAQNGTMMGFEVYQDKLRSKIAPNFLSEIKGDTDTEHLFYLFLSFLNEIQSDFSKVKKEDLETALRNSLKFVEDLYFTYTPNAQRPAFNILLSDGENLLATRLNRTMFILEKDPEKEKPKQAFSQEHHWHIDFGTDDNSYHKIILASEKVTPTDPDWDEVPENSMVSIDKNSDISIFHLRLSF